MKIYTSSNGKEMPPLQRQKGKCYHTKALFISLCNCATVHILHCIAYQNFHKHEGMLKTKICNNCLVCQRRHFIHHYKLYNSVRFLIFKEQRFIDLLIFGKFCKYSQISTIEADYHLKDNMDWNTLCSRVSFKYIFLSDGPMSGRDWSGVHICFPTFTVSFWPNLKIVFFPGPLFTKCRTWWCMIFILRVSSCPNFLLPIVSAFFPVVHLLPANSIQPWLQNGASYPQFDPFQPSRLW